MGIVLVGFQFLGKTLYTLKGVYRGGGYGTLRYFLKKKGNVLLGYMGRETDGSRPI